MSCLRDLNGWAFLLSAMSSTHPCLSGLKGTVPERKRDTHIILDLLNATLKKKLTRR